MSEGMKEASRKPFPIDRLPGAFCDMAWGIVHNQQCGVNLPSMAVLGALNAAVGNRYTVFNPIGIRTTPGNLFLVAVAKSGDGKSSVMMKAFKPIEEHQQAVLKHWRDKIEPRAKARKDLIQHEISQLKSERKARKGKSVEAEGCEAAETASPCPEESGQEVVCIFAPEASGFDQQSEDEDDEKNLEALHRKLKEVEKDLIEPRMIVDDCTPEKMASLLANSSFLVSASAEARKAIDVLMGRYSSKNNDDPADDVYVKAFSGDPIRVDRQGSGSLEIEHPCLSVFWMVQPGKVDKLLTAESLKDSGFLQRCLFGYSEGVTGNALDAQPIGQDVWVAYHEAIKAILGHDMSDGGPGCVRLSREAGLRINEVREAYREGWANKGENSQMFECRYAELAVRIALNLHLGKYAGAWAKRDIDVETVEAAIDILGFFTQNHEAIFTSFEHNETVARSVEVAKLLKTFGGAFTLREARRSPLKSMEPGLEDYLEGEVKEGRLFKFRAGRTWKYTDQRSRAILPQSGQDDAEESSEPPSSSS